MSHDRQQEKTPRNRDDPRTLTVDQLLDTLEASGGFLCVVFSGIGIGTFFKYNPGRNGFEQIESRNKPEKTDDGILVKTETMNHGIYDRETAAHCLENWMGPSVEGHNVEFVPYTDTPFTDSDVTELWGEFDE